MGLPDFLDHQNEETSMSVGVAIGIVTSNKDEEGLGRVKIKLAWRGEEDETFWARIATPMAGNGRGIVFYPEVDDEVLVAFEHGDINYPYVIGALWNGKDSPPEINSDGKNNIRKIKSRSGHELIFNDTKRQEKVEIKTKGGHTIILDDSTGGEKIEVADKTGKNKITINSTQNSITMESAMQLNIKANVVEIEGSTLTLKSSGVLTIQGSLVKIN